MLLQLFMKVDWSENQRHCFNQCSKSWKRSFNPITNIFKANLIRFGSNHEKHYL